MNISTNAKGGLFSLPFQCCPLEALIRTMQSTVSH